MKKVLESAAEEFGPELLKLVDASLERIFPGIHVNPLQMLLFAGMVTAVFVGGYLGLSMLADEEEPSAQ